jgi:acyl carrier protein phosphodiesterase
MNFLAHIYLSNDLPKIMVGNFIGDFVKGRNLLEQFEPDIAKGIELHRIIDAFTDTHPVVKQSKLKLRTKYRHYSAVIVDVFYDHFLAKFWTDYHSVLLPVYANKVYQIIETHRPVLPQEVIHMLPHMIKGNWLVNYGTLEGIEQALTGLARRTRYESKMEQSVNELEEFYPEFKQEFQSFFPELKLHAEEFLKA